MPRYFFHFRNNDGRLTEDFEGQELDGLSAAQDNAMASAKEILAEGLLSGSPVLTGLFFEICDENRKLALDLDLAKKPGNAGEL
ncbi:hypothetical protein NKJ35_06205 [Mesorhizobium sp. M0136]|uniref:DUF6894 family protein n=1 Tax=Mesorhizobium sp. M0136 TaxID=2956890 RepID=UPI003339B991